MSGVVNLLLRGCFCCLIVFGLCFQQYSYAQTGTTRGKEFYISVMPNAANSNGNEVKVFFTTLSLANVSLEVIGTGFKQEFQLAANTSLTRDIPTQFLPSAPEVKERIGIYIESDAEISVYAINQANATSDATLVLPYASLGDEYLVHSYNVIPPQTSVTPQQFSVLATEDSTFIDILFTAPTIVQNSITHQAGQNTTIMLMRGEQIIYNSTEDMSGTRVQARPGPDGSCKKIALFAGHVTTLVGTEQGPDHLYNQLYPLADWGREYVAIPFETRFAGDPIKILAAENNTTVMVNGVPVPLNAREWSLFDITEVTYISADKPISVLQLTKGRNADSDSRGDEFADPFMLVLSPANQVVHEQGFVMMTNDRMERHFVNMVTPTNNLQVLLNNVDISNQFSTVPGNPAYSHASIPLTPGYYLMSSPNGFVAHAYAFGAAESFGYAVGGDLGDFNVRIEDEQFGVVSDGNFSASVCEASELTLTVNSDIDILKNAYTQFTWDMGDGTILSGDTVRHTYAGPGSYPIRMTASKGSNVCSNIFVDRMLEVVDDGLEEIVGPESVCPDVQNIAYTVTGTLPGYTYQWFVDGGTIDGANTGENILVDWSISNPGARVRVLATSPTGCLSDTLDLPIVLNEFLQPAIPRGPAQLCADNIELITYSTPPATGSVYTWQITGGTIISGQGSNAVTVDWDGVGTHSVWFTESTTTTSSLCDGTSPVLQVRVYEALAASADIMTVSCNGEQDGAITLALSGGLAPYNVDWDTGAGGTSLTELTAGRYEATITDALGCVLVQEVVVSEPDLLSGTVVVQDAVCAGERGFAIAEITGGTAPYTYHWSTNVTSASSRLNDLGKGSYSVRVTDVNDCEINLNFDLEEPAALEAVFTMEQACPGLADGSLTLDVTGGVGPYTFDWVIRPASTSALLDEITDGDYDVTITDAVGCTLELTGTVTNQTPRIQLPSAFSPNGDGTNDEFRAVFNCALDFRMLVYNRWGTVVFQSADINEGWDGYFEGKVAPAGSYTYDVRYSGLLNGTFFEESVRGSVKIVR